MPAKKPKEITDEALRLYKTGLSSTEVSKLLGGSISASVVCKIARDSGCIRGISLSKKLRNIRRPKQLEVINGSKIYGSDADVKTCASCGTQHPATTEFFYRRKMENGRSYLSSSCRVCVAKASATRRFDNPEATKESSRRNVEKNGHRHRKQKALRKLFDPAVVIADRERNRAWLKANHDHMIAYRVAYRLENKELIDARERDYREKTRLQQSAARRNYKSRKKGAEGEFSASDTESKLLAQSGLCFWCGSDIKDGFHADHYIPLAKGGNNWPSNIVLACQTCNTSRGSKMPEEFLIYLDKIKGMESEINERRLYFSQKMREHRARKIRS